MDEIRGLLEPRGYGGYFLLENSWRPVSTFSFAEHQAPGSQWDRERPFVNNFLFTTQKL